MGFTKATSDYLDSGGIIKWITTPKTADFTAISKEGYFVNTTSAAITVTLPSSPNAGDEVSIVDYAGTADTNNITITSNDNINGAADDKVINYERGGVSMVYVDATQGWIAYNANNETATALADVPLTIAVDYLVVAGGGSGGGTRSFGTTASGAGGAGGLRTSYGSTTGGGGSAESSLFLQESTNYTVTVGAGGAGNISHDNGNPGSNSVFSTITSTGGGYGSGGSNSSAQAGSGGSGGGAHYAGTGGAAVTSPAVQGYAGGDDASSERNGAGGGGAGAAGANSISNAAGDGGNGLAVSITGSSVSYAGGGGGGATFTGEGGSGGTGGGGNGANGNTSAISGSNNTGGGGGGGSASDTYGYGAAGGSGIVSIRYPNTYQVTVAAGLTTSQLNQSIGGTSDKVTTFTAGTGTITFGAA
jgi:hypothetical protein